MNLDRDDIELEEILHRYFGKELTPSEEHEIEVWSAQSPENQKKFEDSRISYLDLKGLTYYRNTEAEKVDESWKQFKRENQVAGQKKSFTVLKYAASIAVFISVLLAIYLYQNRVEEIMVSSLEEVQDTRLSDGSLVSLNLGSTVLYDEPFQNNERRLRLSGEAWFQVERMPKMPFVVEAGETEVRVLGTTFFVNAQDDRVLVTVEEGKVLVSFQGLHQIVQTGESVSLDLQKKELVEVNDRTGVTTFWKTRMLIFDQTPIEEVINQVNEVYNASIQLEGEMDKCALTVAFNDESLENILEVVSSTLGYEIVEEQGSYILKGNGCK